VSARGKARKRALDVLFEAEVRGEPVLELLDWRVTDASPPVAPYAAELVRGVQAHRDRLDELIAEHAEGWTLDRMPAVDRNILRIGGYELLWAPDVPDAVAISEAVALARDLSTDASPSFVNGVLARLLELKPTLTQPAAEAEAEPADPEPAGPEPAGPEPAGPELKRELTDPELEPEPPDRQPEPADPAPTPP
jgi:transcription antitermination protein NusB